jgi:iron complex outermembrane recepter protein
MVSIAVAIGFAPTAALAQSTETTTPPQQSTPVQAAPTTPGNTTPASPKGNDQQLPPVKVIQKEQNAPKVVEKKTPTKNPVAPVAAQVAAPPAQAAPPVSYGSMVQMSPLAGSEIPLAKVPGGVSTVSGAEISRAYTDFVPDALQTYVPGVVLSDLQGNVFQPSIDYRGFFASPVDGVPQGLAVYQNGVRINEAFGDTVNLDAIPTNAISGITVVSGNPVFGLNALGGAVSINMKDGFSYQGFESDTRFGSFGRAQESLQGGVRTGVWAAYAALEDIYDGGYRDFSPSRIRRMYADLGAKGTDSEFHVNFTGADNFVGVAAASPVELLEQQGWAATFSTPQTTENVVVMPSINGTVQLNDTQAISGLAYYRRFTQNHVDGNISNATPCPIGPTGTTTPTGACSQNNSGDTILLQDTGGNQIMLPDGLSGLGEIDRTFVHTDGYGGALQAVDKDKLFGLGNHFLIGGSIDHANTVFKSSAELGFFQPNFVVGRGGPFVGPFGVTCSPNDDGSCDPTAPGFGTSELSDIRAVSISTQNTYTGLYLTDTLDVTDRFALTAGGRFNIANISTSDNTGLAPDLNSAETYWHFNPTVGGTYKVPMLQGVSLYGGWSEGNRAPVPAELACANPLLPCLLPSFLTGDPPLKQVVSYTYEAGVRGEKLSQHEKLNWSLGYFRTQNNDDIINVQSSIVGRSSFQNAGETLREGMEAQINYWYDRLFVYAGYSFVNATYQTAQTLSSPFNPQATECPGGTPGDGNLCISVSPGDRLPGIPQNRFKAGFDYGLTSKWKFGADFIAVGDQFFFGDDSNQNKELGGYAKVNIHTSYDVTDHVQVYGLVNNLFDAHYGTSGVYFDAAGTNSSGAALGTITFLDPRSIIPAIPLAAYGGVKVRF